jgi:hypothetical protein
MAKAIGIMSEELADLKEHIETFSYSVKKSMLPPYL